MDVNATSFTSPLASLKYGPVNLPPQIEYVVDAISNASAWTIIGTLLAILVAYDQRALPHHPILVDFRSGTVANDMCSQLHYEQGKHRRPCL